MNPYNAIMAAADQIEQHPETYDFHSMGIPGLKRSYFDCGSAGCALGWIGAFSDPDLSQCPWDKNFYAIGFTAENVLGVDSMDFYARMNRIVPGWTKDARQCARGLRLYAAQYHPPGRTDAELVNALVLKLATSPAIPEDATA